MKRPSGTGSAKQNDLLRQANNIVQDDAPVWFFNYNKAVMAYQPWIRPGAERKRTGGPAL